MTRVVIFGVSLDSPPKTKCGGNPLVELTSSFTSTRNYPGFSTTCLDKFLFSPFYNHVAVEISSSGNVFHHQYIVFPFPSFHTSHQQWPRLRVVTPQHNLPWAMG